MEIGASGYSPAELISAAVTYSVSSGEGSRVSSAPASQEPPKNGRSPAVGQASLFASDSDSTRNGSSATTLTLSTNSDIRALLTTMGRASGSRPESRQSMDVENAAQGETKDTDSSEELTEEEQAQVDELQKRDQEVRQHEQAHLAAGGTLVNGGAQFDFQTGPDGKQYAIGGHVNIDSSPENTPQATIAKAQQIQRAALAPADPSSQDVKVAAKAAKMMLDAQRKLAEPDTAGDGDSDTSESQNIRGGVPGNSGAEATAAALSAYGADAGGGKLETA